MDTNHRDHLRMIDMMSTGELVTALQGIEIGGKFPFKGKNAENIAAKVKSKAIKVDGLLTDLHKVGAKTAEKILAHLDAELWIMERERAIAQAKNTQKLTQKVQETSEALVLAYEGESDFGTAKVAFDEVWKELDRVMTTETCRVDYNVSVLDELYRGAKDLFELSNQHQDEMRIAQAIESGRALISEMRKCVDKEDVVGVVAAHDGLTALLEANQDIFQELKGPLDEEYGQAIGAYEILKAQIADEVQAAKEAEEARIADEAEKEAEKQRIEEDSRQAGAIIAFWRQRFNMTEYRGILVTVKALISAQSSKEAAEYLVKDGKFTDVGHAQKLMRSTRSRDGERFTKAFDRLVGQIYGWEEEGVYAARKVAGRQLEREPLTFRMDLSNVPVSRARARPQAKPRQRPASTPKGVRVRKDTPVLMRSLLHVLQTQVTAQQVLNAQP